MSRRSILRGSAAAASILLLAILPGLGSTATASPGAPPPLPFVSQLDLACYKTDAYTPPATVVATKHLNPVLAELPTESTRLGVRDQLCVPVEKNGKTPPAGIIEFVRWVDLSCYRIDGQTVNFPLKLSQLNPVVQALGIPDSSVVMARPEQLCVPVAKNGKIPPPEVLRVVQHIDLKCYSLGGIALPGEAFPLTLGHLNPVLANLPKVPVKVTNPRQLCVPVLKKGDEIPADVLNTVQWIDQEKFDVVAGPGTGPAAIELKLTHLNPVLAGLPNEPAVISGPVQLGLPVAKNGKIPPLT